MEALVSWNRLKITALEKLENKHMFAAWLLTTYPKHTYGTKSVLVAFCLYGYSILPRTDLRGGNKLLSVFGAKDG